jgi:DNA-binding transcriptional MerR regulator
LILQNILALKFLGFSLEEIRMLLQTGPHRLEEVLAQQKAMMQEKRAQLDTIIQAIEETERLLQTNRCNWESIVQVIQVIQMGQHNDDWRAKYFTPEQQKTMEELHRKAYTAEAEQKLKTYHPNEWTEEDQKRVDEQYRFVKQELGRLVAQGADPASPEAQHVAQIKQELGIGFSQGDPDIAASVGKWWQEFSALPEEQRPFDASVYMYTEAEEDFLKKALAIYRQRHGQ